jgi:glycosyltransferase involved in cell wall biosynthesis
MEVHGRRLAAALRGAELRSDIAGRSADRFGVRAGDAQSFAALAADAAFLARLRRINGPLHFTSHHLARYGPFSGRPYLVTVHDMIRHLDLAAAQPLIQTYTGRDRVMLALDRLGIRRAAACITISRHSAQSLIDRLQIPPDRVHVVHQGIDHERFRPTPARPVQGTYLLFVGSEHPRKNLRALLAAFAELKREPRFAELKLVKVGAPGNPPGRFRARTLADAASLGIADDVIFTGRVADDELPGYYAGAACLILPSVHEGFGLPPIEAMACGCPVVASTSAALPEITGGAALLVDPHDVRGLRDAVRTVLTDPALAGALRRRGRRQAAHFTWPAAARATRAVYAAVWAQSFADGFAAPYGPAGVCPGSSRSPRAGDEPLAIKQR